MRGSAIAISLFALPMLLMGLIAPFMLVFGVIWLSTAVWSAVAEKRFEKCGVVVALLSLASVLGFCFIPLWIAEWTAKTPDDYVMLAEGFRRRGQILGNLAKTQAYYMKAAEGGDIEAQARVGEAFFFGHYGLTNRDDGIKWLKVAASNGHQRSLQLLQSIEPN